MGYFYDWIDQKWQPIDHARKLTVKQRRRLSRRKILMDDLLLEIDKGHDAITTLYGTLLLRTLAKTDELLMREYGEQIAKLAPEREARPNLSMPG
jgi:hypothetical protein